MRIEVDGARGEGGGQILRTSLALSMITGKPLRIDKIRANRGKPGLRHQHLACVRAAAQLCAAETVGAHVNSQTLEFTPSTNADAWPSSLHVDIGTVGSTSLVLQTVLVPAIAARRSFQITIIGGTHNPLAPPFDFLDRVFVPQLRAMGANVTLTLDRHGFATGGGGAAAQQNFHDEVTPYLGQITAKIEPGELRGIDLFECGEIASRHAVSIIARLPTHVATRELREVTHALGFSPAECETREVEGQGRGNVVMIELERARGASAWPPRNPAATDEATDEAIDSVRPPVRELVTEFGQKSLRAEVVGHRCVQQAQAYLAHGAPVGEHLADQLLLPMAVAGAGRFRSGHLSLHATTNIDTIRQFLDVPIDVVDEELTSTVTVGSRGSRR